MYQGFTKATQQKDEMQRGRLLAGTFFLVTEALVYSNDTTKGKNNPPKIHCLYVIDVLTISCVGRRQLCQLSCASVKEIFQAVSVFCQTLNY